MCGEYWISIKMNNIINNISTWLPLIWDRVVQIQRFLSKMSCQLWGKIKYIFDTCMFRKWIYWSIKFDLFNKSISLSWIFNRQDEILFLFLLTSKIKLIDNNTASTFPLRLLFSFSWSLSPWNTSCMSLYSSISVYIV